jgi:PAS domain S-box-containing protein
MPTAPAPSDLLFATLNALPHGVAVFQLDDPADDQSLRLVHANQASSDVVGFDFAAEKGRRIAEILPGMSESPLPGIYAEVARSGEAQDLGEVVYGDERLDAATFRVQARPVPPSAVAVVFVDVTGEVAERRAAEEQARRFEAVFHSAFQFTGLLAPDGTALEANEAALAFAGASIDEIRGRKLWETPWFPEDQRARLRAVVGQAARGEFVRYTTEIQGADGRRLHIDFSVKPVLGEDGEVVLLVPEGRDVTALVESAERLATTNARQHAILKTLEEGVVLYDADGRVMLSNQAAERLLGAEPADISEKGFSAAAWRPVRPDGSRYTDADLPAVRALTLGEPVRGDILGLPQAGVEGGTRWLSVNALPLRREHADGLPGGVLVSLYDVTAQRRAEAALRQSESRIRTIVDNAPVVFYAIDRDGRFVMSRGMARGDNAWGDVHGRHLDELAQDHPIFQPMLNAFRGGASQWTVSNDGRTYEHRAVRMLDDDGAPDSMVGVATDVTERARAKALLSQQQVELQRQAAELEERNAELEQFAYVASHDLQEPLRMVTSFLQLLERRFAEQIDEAGREYIGYAVDGARRMQTLIQDLLAYSRVGTHGKAFGPVDLGDEIETVFRDLGPLLAETGAEVRVVNELPTVEGDAGQLRQVFQNLIANAVKFRRPDVTPRVQIAAEPAEVDGAPGWAVSVEDNGIGIDPKYADRVFQVFQRLHTRDEYAGTGIGLAIVKKVVERHGGTIAFEPAREGPGTRFVVRVPARMGDGTASLP